MKPSGVCDVSVVICAYDTRRWDCLCAAVDSAFDQTLAPTEVIVVVDHNAELLEMATARFAGARVIENSGERGLSDARNTGVEMAEGGIVAFIDDDAAADPTWLEYLSAAYVDHGVLGVGGKVDPLWETTRPHWFPAEFLWVVGCTYEGAPTTRSPVRNMIGANMSVRRDILAEAGGFREDLGHTHSLPMGGEETELCIRIAEQHPEGVFLFEPRARVLHRVSAGRTRWSYLRLRCYSEGRSKAQITYLFGTGRGLASERQHVLRTLPAGMARGLADTVTGRDAWGFAQTATIVAGLAITTCGYLVGRTQTAVWAQFRS